MISQNWTHGPRTRGVKTGPNGSKPAQTGICRPMFCKRGMVPVLPICLK